MIELRTVCSVNDRPAIKVVGEAGLATARIKSIRTGRIRRMTLGTLAEVGGGRYILMPPDWPMGDLCAIDVRLMPPGRLEAWFRSDEEVPLGVPDEVSSEILPCAQAHGPAPESACAGARVDVEPEDAQERPTEPEGSEEDVQDPQEPEVAPEGTETPSRVNKLPSRQEIVDMLRLHSRPMTSKDMAAAFGIHYDVVRSRLNAMLSDMEDKGMIRRADKSATGGASRDHMGGGGMTTAKQMLHSPCRNDVYRVVLEAGSQGITAAEVKAALADRWAPRDVECAMRKLRMNMIEVVGRRGDQRIWKVMQ